MKKSLKVLSYKIFHDSFLSETRIKLQHGDKEVTLYYHLLGERIYEDEKSNWQLEDYTFEEVEKIIQTFFTKEEKEKIRLAFEKQCQKIKDELKKMLSTPYEDTKNMVIKYNTLYNERVNTKHWLDIFTTYETYLNKRKNDIENVQVKTIEPIYRNGALQDITFNFQNQLLSFTGIFSDLEIIQHVNKEDLEEICPLCGLKKEDELGESICLYFSDAEKEMREKIMYHPTFRVRGVTHFPTFYKA